MRTLQKNIKHGIFILNIANVDVVVSYLCLNYGFLIIFIENDKKSIILLCYIENIFKFANQKQLFSICLRRIVFQNECEK